MLRTLRRSAAGVVAVLLCAGGLAAVTQGQALAEDGTPGTCAQYGYGAGFRSDTLVKAIAIGMAESRCLTYAGGPAPQDQGMWQIKATQEHVQQYGDLLDPVNNARAAYAISSQGHNWGAWSTNCENASTPSCYAYWMGAARRAARPYLVPDTNGDGYGDIVGIDSAGKLVGYNNGTLLNAEGRPFKDQTWWLPDSDWTSFRRLALGDVNDDGFADLLAVRGDGALVVYPNGTLVNPDGRPYADQGWVMSGNWDTMTQFAAGDVTGDNYADIVAVDASGALVVYANGIRTNPDGKPFSTETWRLGNWSTVKDITVIDVNADHYADLVGIDKDGKLFGYDNGSLVNQDRAPFAHETWRVPEGNWSGTKNLTAADTNGDGYGDLIAAQTDGSLLIYGNKMLPPGNDDIPYQNVAYQSSGAWNTFRAIA